MNKRTIGLIFCVTAIFGYFTFDIMIATKSEAKKSQYITDFTKLKKQIKKNTKVIPIRSLTVDESRTIYLTGVINGDSLTLVDKINNLARDSNKPIYLILSSPGGSVVMGAQIVTAIQLSRAPVYTIAYIQCASMCAVIHQHGYKRLAIPRAILMFHPASDGVNGDIDRMVSYLSTIQRYIAKFDYYIAKRIGMSYSDYKHKIAVEWWIDSHDAVRANVVDELVTIQNASFLDFIGIGGKKQDKLKILRDLKW